MKRLYCHIFFIFTIILIHSSCAYKIEQPQLNILWDSFILSIEDDPDIKSVSFNININREFENYETPQIKCMANFLVGRWFCELNRKLRDQDIIYTWLLVKRGSLSYRDRKNPISVGAFLRGDRNYILTTTSRTPDLSQSYCQEAITRIRNMTGTICRGQLVFEDNFDQFNAEYWTNEIRIPNIEHGSEFVIYNGIVEANDGILKISANLWNNRSNKVFDLGERCTSRHLTECRLHLSPFYFLPSIVSGRINSEKHFNFKYGRIEVRAKVPKGDWLFPLITLHPSRYANGLQPSGDAEIRIAFVRGNHQLIWNNISIGGDTLFGGPILYTAANERSQFMSNVTLTQTFDDSTTPKHFGNKFHVYSLLWTLNELVFSVDNMEYGKIQMEFDQMFHITLGVAAGGMWDFPENVQNKPWQNFNPRAIKQFRNQKTTWFPTWIQPTLEIDYVRVYAV